jgi:hypothetical protein
MADIMAYGMNFTHTGFNRVLFIHITFQCVLVGLDHPQGTFRWHSYLQLVIIFFQRNHNMGNTHIIIIIIVNAKREMFYG